MSYLTKSMSTLCFGHKRLMCSLAKYSFNNLLVTNPEKHVFLVQLNRPKKLNAISLETFKELKECFEALGSDTDCRSIVFGGKGKMMTAGIDLTDLVGFADITSSEDDVANKCRQIKRIHVQLQEVVTSIEKCPKPVIAAIHNACIGMGIHLTSAADVRYCSADSWFTLKEVDLGFAPDVGALQRLPKIMGSESFVKELSLSCRRFWSDEALTMGLVSRVLPHKRAVKESAIALGSLIAAKSPVGVQATKEASNHARDHSVQQGLDFQADKNMVLLQSGDVMKAIMAQMNKEKAEFENY